MTNRQFNVLIVCIGISWIALMWIGYKLRQWVERWQDRRGTRRWRWLAERYTGAAAEAITAGTRVATEQDARRVLKGQKIKTIPLHSDVDPNTGRTRMQPPIQRIPREVPPSAGFAIPPGWLPKEPSSDRDLRAGELHKDAIAALVSSGFKHTLAVTAVHACAPEERVDLETWVAAAIRRAVSK